MIGAAILGIVAGYLARALLPRASRRWAFSPPSCSTRSGRWSASSSSPRCSASATPRIFDLGGTIGAVIGAMVVLFIYDRVVASRAAKSEPASVRCGRRRSAPAVSRAPSDGAPSGDRPGRDDRGRQPRALTARRSGGGGDGDAAAAGIGHPPRRAARHSHPVRGPGRSRRGPSAGSSSRPYSPRVAKSIARSTAQRTRRASFLCF